MGVRLFQRTTRRLSLTEAGANFYRTCTGVLAELEQAELGLTAQDGDPHGRVRIDLPASYGRLHVLPLILELLHRYPLLQPDLSFADRFVDPVHEGIDILVRIGGSDAWPAAWGIASSVPSARSSAPLRPILPSMADPRPRPTWSITSASAFARPTAWSVPGSYAASSRAIANAGCSSRGW